MPPGVPACTQGEFVVSVFDGFSAHQYTMRTESQRFSNRIRYCCRPRSPKLAISLAVTVMATQARVACAESSVARTPANAAGCASRQQRRSEIGNRMTVGIQVRI